MVSHMKKLISHQQKHIHTFRLEGYVSFAVSQIMAKIVKSMKFQNLRPNPPKDPPSDTTPRTHARTPPAPHTHPGDAREQRGTYIVGLDGGVGPVVEEAERSVAVTTGACPKQWGIAPLLTRDTEGHTHVSTTPHTTHARAMQRGWGMGRGCRGCVRGWGAGRRGTDQRERTAGGRGGPKTQKVTFHKNQESESGNPHRGHNRMVGVHVTKGSTTQNSMRIDIKTSTLSPPEIEGIFGGFSKIVWAPARVRWF